MEMRTLVCAQCSKNYEYPLWRIRQLRARHRTPQFCSWSCFLESKQRQPWTPDNWDDGYVCQGRFRVYRPDYPEAFPDGYALRYQVVWWLATGEVSSHKFPIHHRDHNALNDNIENLIRLSGSEHISAHKSHYTLRRCQFCRKSFPISTRKLHEKSRRTRGTYCSIDCYHRATRRKP